MDLRIESFLKDAGFDGVLSSDQRNRSLVRTKQLIYYILSQYFRFRSIAKIMDCSHMTAYRGAKYIKENKEKYSELILKVKAQLANNYDFETLNEKHYSESFPFTEIK